MRATKLEDFRRKTHIQRLAQKDKVKLAKQALLLNIDRRKKYGTFST